MKALKTDRSKQLHEFNTRMDETFSSELNNKKAFDDEIQSNLTSILASDESRRAAFQLTYEEEQQNVAVCVQLQLPVLLKYFIIFFLSYFLWGGGYFLNAPFSPRNYLYCFISMLINKKCYLDRKNGYTCFVL